MIQEKHPQLREIVEPKAPVTRVLTGFESAQGPVFSRIGYLLFSDFGARKIWQWTIKPWAREPLEGERTLLRDSAHSASSLTFDHQGRLLACETGGARVTRTEKDGSITVLAESGSGSKLQGPRDLIYSIDGSIYFSDPPAEGTANASAAVYQITPKGDLRPVIDDLPQPGGVALGPKQLDLYVADSSLKQIRVYEVEGDGALRNGRVFAELDPSVTAATGVDTDEAGNVYCASSAGIAIYDPEGRHLGAIVTPEPPNNLGWGRGFRGLYITAGASVYHVPTKIPGTRTF